jgi:tyrosyl-tRNA synthetase
LEQRINLVTRNTQEVVTGDELRVLLETDTKPKAYWGFESSGLMHIGMGLVCGSKIKDMVKAGFDFTIFLADWHSWINNKLGGNMEKIHICGEYFKECFTALGIKPESVRYAWASDLAKDGKYWEKVVRIAKNISLQRTWRALPILGRETNLTDMETAWVYYPSMQAADIFHMEKDRQFDEDKNINMQISSKMSKSMPESCIFVHDEPKAIKTKINAAFCPPKQAEGNPVLEIAKCTIFTEKPSLMIPRSPKYGGPENFNKYEELEKAYVEGKLHPLDLKEGVAEALIEILSSVREYFSKHPKKLDEMRKIEITR